MDFLKVVFSCEMLEGYGMTESGLATCQKPGDPISGHVGGPSQNSKIRLRDLPEMGYLNTDDPPRGEICLWGPTVTKGYFKNPEKTAEMFHNGGELHHDRWLCTGDVATVLSNGSIKIFEQ